MLHDEDHQMRTAPARAGARLLTLVAGLVAIALSVAACTGEEPVGERPDPPAAAPAPEAPTGTRVAVVLPPATEVDTTVISGISAQLVQLERELADDVAELRGHPAGERPFVSDMAGRLAEQRADLVCVLGSRADAVVAPLAAIYRGVRFCALPTSGGAGTSQPDEVVRVELRVEELGHLVGAAARAQAGDRPIALLLGPDALPTEPFRAGILAGAGDAEVVEPGPSAATGTRMEDRAEAALAAGAAVIVVDASAGATEAIRAIAGRADVISPVALVGAAPGGGAVLSWSIRWDRALTGPIEAVAGSGRLAQSYSLGLREGVFELVAGANATDAMRSVVATTTDRLLREEIDPRAPSPASGDERATRGR